MTKVLGLRLVAGNTNESRTSGRRPDQQPAPPACGGEALPCCAGVQQLRDRPAAIATLTRLVTRLAHEAKAHRERTAMPRNTWRRARPVPGWNAGSRAVALANPRPPAVPTSLEITLDEYFAAAATIGLLSAQEHEPDPEWAKNWSLDYGERMAREARRRRARSRGK